MYCSSEEGGGWKFQSSCYHVVTEIKPWEKAEKYCKDNYAGHLVTILDLVEDSFLEYILADIKKDLWIGIKIQVTILSVFVPLKLLNIIENFDYSYLIVLCRVMWYKSVRCRRVLRTII